MSGGSYSYAYGQIQDLAGAIRAKSSNSGNQALRVAFADLLEKCAVAAHDIEWVDSGDYGAGDEKPALEAVVSAAAELDAAVALGEAARDQLSTALTRAAEHGRKLGT